MKKCVCLLFALVFALSFLTLPASAAVSNDVVIHLSDDLDGLTGKDYEKFAEFTSGNCSFDLLAPAGPVYFADYAGTAVDGPLTAGRTYSVYYSFVPDEGLDAQNCELKFDCDSGVEVISFSAVRYAKSETAPERYGLSVFAQITVRGSFFQRVAGFILDLIAKIKAWQLY